MYMFCKNIHCLAVLLSVCLGMTTLSAQEIDPPLGNKVIKAVSHRDVTESRDHEFLIDTNIVYTPEAHNQVSPSIAFDGINYLMVCQDNGSNNGEIYGTLVSQDGVVLNPAGIQISTATGHQRLPSVVFLKEVLQFLQFLKSCLSVVLYFPFHFFIKE